MSDQRFSRRKFLQSSAMAAAAISIVPSHVLGKQASGAGGPAPSEKFGAALIGCGDRGPSTIGQIGGWGLNIQKLAECDVKFKNRADNKTIYTDFRRVVERKDIDIVAIATPPHWHALISIAAMEAGKDVLCEKPMTHTIAQGRAVAEAEKRYKRIFQVGTFGRFGMQGGDKRTTRKIMLSGLPRLKPGCVIHRGGFKVRGWSGDPNLPVKEIPANLDWDMYCGPSPLKPYVQQRTGGSHRNYWDYDGGGLSDMGQHYLDGICYLFGLDTTAPVEIETCAPPAHPECTGMWSWSKLKYADGFMLVLESNEEGSELTGLQNQNIGPQELADADQAKLKALPDPEPLLNFGQAVKTRKPAGGNAELAHRTACVLHLTNISIRTGRKIKFDPVKEEVVGDPEANRLVNPPMRAPWHL